MAEPDRYILSVLVENQSGVLARIAGLFSGRGYNIAALSVGETTDPEISRMTIVLDESDPRTLEQVVKQLQKLVVTIKVEDFEDRPYVHSELLLCKVTAKPSQRNEIMNLADVFNGKVVDLSNETMTLRFVGHNNAIKDVLELLRPYGIKEIARTGSVALSRESFS